MTRNFIRWYPITFLIKKKLAMINSNWAKARAIKNFNSLKNIKLLINNYKIQLIINNYKIQLIINNYKIQLIINNYFFLYLFFKSFKNWIRLKRLRRHSPGRYYQAFKWIKNFNC